MEENDITAPAETEEAPETERSGPPIAAGERMEGALPEDPIPVEELLPAVNSSDSQNCRHR